jgi:hypothetical protein
MIRAESPVPINLRQTVNKARTLPLSTARARSLVALEASVARTAIKKGFKVS